MVLIRLLVSIMVVLGGIAAFGSKDYGRYAKIDFNLVNSYRKELYNLSDKQIDVIRLISDIVDEYEKTNNNWIDKCYIMAIAWKESSFGLRAHIVSKTNDYGVMQININNYKQNKHAMSKKLMGTEFNIREGIRHYLMWKKIAKYPDYRILAAYNGGYRMNYKYGTDVKHRYIALKYELNNILLKKPKQNRKRLP